MDHRPGPSQGLAARARVAHLPEVSKRDPDIDPVPAKPAWVAYECSDLIAPLDKHGEERLADGARGSGQEDHAEEVT